MNFQSQIETIYPTLPYLCGIFLVALYFLPQNSVNHEMSYSAADGATSDIR